MEDLAKLVREHPFWKDLPPAHLPVLAEGASLVHFDAGSIIYEEGRDAEGFYLLQRGRVAIEAFVPGRGAVSIQTLGPGEALGWSWLFAPYRWHFGASAREATEAIGWQAAPLRTRALADRDFGFELFSRLALVLQQRLQATRMQLLDFYDGHR